MAGGRPGAAHTSPSSEYGGRLPVRAAGIAALVHGSGYERIATPGCSDRTIRRRLADWADLGLGEELHAAALRAYDQVIGLELASVAVDGCHTKHPAAASAPGRRRLTGARAG